MMAENQQRLASDLDEFLASMPPAYARAFTLREIEQHARIVQRRGRELAHVELWFGPGEQAFVCVVADDQPGLLSLVTDALLMQGLSVSRAEVYCRRCQDARYEAVDLFCLEWANADTRERAIESADIASFAQTLCELLAENRVSALPPSERDTIPVPGPRPSRVYFELEALRRGEHVLIVETPDSAGLLFAISSALHGQSIRILASEVRTEHGLAQDRFHVECVAGRPMSAERLCDVQQAVREAVHALASPRG
jgi:UTP:GlnB (protein PII) uridylyltransferase